MAAPPAGGDGSGPPSVAEKAVRPGWACMTIILSLFDLSEWHLRSDSVNRSDRSPIIPLRRCFPQNAFPPVAIPEENEDEEPLALPLRTPPSEAVRTVAGEQSAAVRRKRNGKTHHGGKRRAARAVFRQNSAVRRPKRRSKKGVFQPVGKQRSQGFCLDLGENLPNHAIKPKSAGILKRPPEG